jgi:hypothetical protein
LRAIRSRIARDDATAILDVAGRRVATGGTVVEGKVYG